MAENMRSFKVDFYLSLFLILKRNKKEEIKWPSFEISLPKTAIWFHKDSCSGLKWLHLTTSPVTLIHRLFLESDQEKKPVSGNKNSSTPFVNDSALLILVTFSSCSAVRCWPPHSTNNWKQTASGTGVGNTPLVSDTNFQTMDTLRHPVQVWPGFDKEKK